VTPTFPNKPENGVPTHDKQKVALSSLVAAAVLTALKIVVGLLTGSLGILSEAAHSGLDFVAAAVTYFSVRVSDKPADSSHPFGHGKIEHLSAFIESALLLLTCAWIIFEAVKRLFFREVHVEPSLAAFGVMFVSITVDTFRSRALFRVARKYNSQALEADALHFSTDVYSSSVVILGLVLVYIAEQRNLPWLRDADPVAALVVAGIVVYISLRLGKKTVDALVDAAPEGASAEISRAVSGVRGVLSHERVRVRQSGGRLFIDLGVTLESNIPFEHARSLVEEVEQTVQGLFPAADVVIHAVPRPPASSDLLEKVRAIAHRARFEIHDLTAYAVKGRVNVSLDLELDPALRLDKAHEVASVLEEEIKRELAEVEEVNIHIEPRQSRVESGDEARAARGAMETKLLEIARETPGLVDCHALEAHEVGGNVLVRVHATLEADLALTQVHDITEDLEFRFRKAFPQIFKVSIHAEPKGTS
jgi:cation diffusion facilitator family transporter